MRSRLNGIKNWDELAAEALYSTHALAAIVGVTERQLERYFKDEKRGLPHVWLNELRQARAMYLLNLGHTVKEVSGMVGYKQPSTFSREFKRHHGAAPADFRSSSSHKTQIDTKSRE
jgi:AraC-like DNA-binding protein